VAQIAENLKKSVAGGKSVHVLDHIAADLKRMTGGTAIALNGDDSRAELEEVRSTARRLQAQLETVQAEMESFAATRVCVSDLLETSDLLDSVSDGIRRSVMDMRMLPIGPLFTRFHRVIRDITRNNGKDIHLSISGEKTELDKRMIDELGDPMIHLIRNGADHGIEAPEAREAAGKPRQGTISLDAFHRGSNMVIRVSDDGKGLDANRIRDKAVEKGIISATDAEQMTRQQIFQLIWLPGLSTAEKVTDVSGRGVGMDIVRSKINELSGTVDVDSEPGRGTTFTIKLPLTLAILPSLMVEIDKDVFAIPLESVLEIIYVRRSELTTVHGQWMAPVRDRIIGILTLGGIFKWRQRSNTIDVGEADGTTLVIIGEGDQQVGLAVDRVRGEEDVVIKSIGENYRNVTGIAGASILGDGRITLILDPATLIEMSSQPAAVAAT
jgi:two-component system, chemotaxis family, sensor kinase CheA